MIFSEKLIIDNASVQTKDELFNLAAKKLSELKMINNSYLPALQRREKSFPTGLQTKTIGVAIPHCDPINIKKDGILVVRLNKPIPFQQMGSSDTEVEVKIVFFICSTGAQQQLQNLRELIAMFQDDSFLKEVYQSKDLFDALSLWKGK
ncbi:PTS sugar transporter subunit IIA [Lactobacillus sp. ESL0679]|uniref:PTS sugar transporter subunit IIA n=1 Tax=Lactobacillus sp. ESL0679 TaxID=2983209 RepID=UPI0023F67843|nr:PTS sugar transporter subunit IIA [Lactobacillus sp. ESL0679]MDF7682699.1 PTS sugar transporter subunit IIA [Lactobacillus sp. ESL0679]